MEDQEYTFTNVYCYKKRVIDNRLVLIGEVAFHNKSDKALFLPWNPKIVGGKECSTKNTYYPDFYDSKGEQLEVDYHAYNVQIYLEPPSDSFLSKVNNFPLTTGIINTETPDINGGLYIDYWDTYVDNRVIDICYQTNELYKELRKLRGVE